MEDANKKAIRAALIELQAEIDAVDSILQEKLELALPHFAVLRVGCMVQRLGNKAIVISRFPVWDAKRFQVSVWYEIRKINMDGSLHKVVNTIWQSPDGVLSEGWGVAPDAAKE
jgi:hypothetical protein